MVLPPTYSRRMRQAQGGDPDVYYYDRIPHKLRVQVVHIFSDAIGDYSESNYGANHPACYDSLVRNLYKEFGVFKLVDGYHETPRDEFFAWIQSETDIERLLDGYEFGLRLIDRHIRSEWLTFRHSVETSPDDAIAEANARFREAGAGYQYVSGEIIKVDSAFIHKEVILPVLALLHDPTFAAAEKEYLAAHEAYRLGRFEDCIVSCGKAFESVLKVIGGRRNWHIKENDPASKLIQAAVEAKFLATYSQESLTHLRCLMESSTPTIRNKAGGHGAGQVVRDVPSHLAAFQLHQTAAVILFLVEQDAAFV
jgi:AbiJ N-terminal domain 4